MRVAYDHQIFVAQRYGGISRYFVELANRVSRAPGVKAIVLALAHRNAHLANVRPGLLVGLRLNEKMGGAFRLFDVAVAPIGLALFRPQIVHETYYSRRRLAPRRARVVVTVHDMIHELHPSSFPPWDSTAALKAAAVARADHVICISENTRRDLLRLSNVSPSRTSVVNLGWGLCLEGAKVAPPLKDPYLLHVGNRGGYKNFRGLLEAFARSARLRRDFKLVAFGGGAFTSAERDDLSRLGLAPSQVLHFGGGDGVLAALYRQASVFVYPSLYEGFGIPLLEAMSFDCPVVCGRTSSLPEVAGEAAEYFDPADPEGLQAAVERVVGSPQVAASLKARGRQRLDRFSWEKCAQQTLEIYRRL